MNDPVPSRRLCADHLIAEVNARTGCALEFVGIAEHGESGGAVYVRWPAGRPGVITRTHLPIERTQQTAEVLALARQRGLPVPRYDLVIELADGQVAVVQERLPGNPVSRVDVSMIDELVAMNDRFAGLLAGRPDVSPHPVYPDHSERDDPRYELFRNYSKRTSRILDRSIEISRDAPPGLAGDDLVHPDYARGNVLVDGDARISGVIDWSSGASKGDRAFALVSMRSDLEWSRLNAGGRDPVQQLAIDRLNEVLRSTIEPNLLLRYWAHWTLIKLYWAIVENQPGVNELFLRLGEEWLE